MASIDLVDEIEVSEIHVSNMIQRGIIELIHMFHSPGKKIKGAHH